ncbi:hypothetical protein E0H47_27630 [Rhizobium leguminosarum bv. viciae]|uniref:hypothetical protein n=1 Tax=Rhizobium leguminosarum TaxID=384 RepID=UPI001037AFA7|nr:hypothetical protein [Rhizobium leguminosarum]TBG89382.1 hypothetical protein ELG67_09915 [Rhizobium leguminosarum]TBZ33440.1 hypothetical protein E0H47_27630 [Rhizobium leguminosarum bv. viciae]
MSVLAALKSQWSDPTNRVFKLQLLILVLIWPMSSAMELSEQRRATASHYFLALEEPSQEVPERRIVHYSLLGGPGFRRIMTKQGEGEMVSWPANPGEAILVNVDGGGSLEGVTPFVGSDRGASDSLTAINRNHDGKLIDDELKTLGFWFDDGDGVLRREELRMAGELGLTSMIVESDRLPVLRTTSGDDLPLRRAWFLRSCDLTSFERRLLDLRERLSMFFGIGW